MKYLKKYKQLLEGKEIPDGFIRLNSIGHVLDPDNGEMYAIFKNGDYDYENGYDFDSEAAESLTDEERKEVELHMSTTEDVFNERVDSNLISDVDDILTEITDMIQQQTSLSYGAWVGSGTLYPPINIWHKRIRDGKEDVGFNSLFPYHKRVAKKGDVDYTFRISDMGAFTYKLTDGRVGSLSLLFKHSRDGKFLWSQKDSEKFSQISDTIVDTLTRIALYLNSTGYNYHINGMSDKLNTLPHREFFSPTDEGELSYEKAVRNKIKENLEFGAFNSEIVVTVNHK